MADSFKFRLLAGTHNQGGKTYKRGDVIGADDDLTEMFPGMFAREFDRKLAVSPGEEEMSLARLRRNEASNQVQPAQPAAEDDAAETQTQTAVPKAGTDVTDEFKGASEKGLTVTFDNGEYEVTDGDGKVVATVNTKVAAKAAVKKHDDTTDEE